MDMNRRTYYCDSLDKKVEWTVVLLFHGIATTGVAILAIGVSNLDSSNVKLSDISTDDSLVKAGIALLTLSWAIVAIVSVWALAHPAKSQRPKSSIVAGTRVSVFHGRICKYPS
jgi:hypothetical protein